MSFASLLAPMTIAEFREKHWARAALVFPKRPDRFEGFPFDFDALCEAMRRSDYAEVKAQYFDKQGTHKDMGIKAWQIKGSFDAGMTVCITRVDPFSPALEALVASWRRSLCYPGKMSFSCYWSPDGAGFGTHYDDRPVFILQLRGSKQWWFSRTPATREPLANFIYTKDGAARLREEGLDIEEPADEAMDTVVLEPGDILYLPAGTWHRTSAVGESLALTLRAFEGTPAQIARETLQRLFDDDPTWRTPMPLVDQAEQPDHRVHGAIKSVLEERLEVLKAFVNGLTIADLARTWADAQSVEAIGPPPGPIGPADRVAVGENVRVLRAGEGADECFFVFNGERELELPVRDNAWFEAVLGAGEFEAGAARAWGGGMPWEDAKELLEDLAQRGVLHVCERSNQ